MDKKQIETLIRDYTKALDSGNAEAAEAWLDQAFRVVLHNYKNSGATRIIEKDSYLRMIREGLAGGNPRELNILLVDIADNTALVKVKLSGDKSVFTNYYSLISRNGQWRIVQDLPQISPVAA